MNIEIDYLWSHKCPKKWDQYTLIALVITIIILLILTTVTIVSITGDNGILKKALLARDKYKNSQDEEDTKLNGIESQIPENDSNLPENTVDTIAGTQVKLPEGWYVITASYVSTANGSIEKKPMKIANVTAVSDGNSNTIPVPNGFYYVGGNKTSGVVISDSKEDQNKYAGKADVPTDLQGNQFVWIPCLKENYKTIASKTYNAYSDMLTNPIEKELVGKYNGFYIGRYEADTDNEILTAQEKDKVQTIYSKADLYPINWISVNNMMKCAEEMYANSNSVVSCIPSGTAWDVMLKTINDNTEKDIYDDITNWANCVNTSINITSSNAKFSSSGKNTAWANISGKTTSGADQLLTTGASEDNKKYNLYEIAGNLWEATSENNTAQSGGVKLYRGSCSWDTASSTYLPDYRGYWGTNAANVVYGFRVCLFLK